MNQTLSLFAQAQIRDETKRIKSQFLELVQQDQYIGEVYSIGYESALIQIHDFHRKQVGGILA